MKQLILVLTGWLALSFSALGQSTPSAAAKETYKRLFLKTCISEAKKQNVNADIKGFCACSFDKFYNRALESGADFEEDPSVLEVISKSPEYEKEVQLCLLENITKDEVNALFEKEFMKSCIKSINKDKYMRKNTDANEICECSFAKLKDGKYSLLQLNELSQAESEEYVKKISEDCMIYFLEKKGVIID